MSSWRGAACQAQALYLSKERGEGAAARSKEDGRIGVVVFECATGGSVKQ